MQAGATGRTLQISAVVGEDIVLVKVIDQQESDTTPVKSFNRAVASLNQGATAQANTLLREIAGHSPASPLQKIIVATARCLSTASGLSGVELAPTIAESDAHFDYYLQAATHFFNTRIVHVARRHIDRAAASVPNIAGLKELVRASVSMKFYDVAARAMSENQHVIAGDAEFLLERARIYIGTRNREEALKDAINATNQLGLTHATALVLGSTALISDRQDLMGRCYEFLNTLPDDARAHTMYRWAMDAHTNGFFDRAALLLKPLIESDPANTNLKLKFVSSMLSAGQLTGLKSLLDDLLAANPDDSRALIEHARYCFLVGEARQAQTFATKVIKTEPNSVPALRILADTRAKKTPSDILSRFAALLDDSHRSLREKSHIAYSLGALKEQNAEFEHAFNFYMLANRHQEELIQSRDAILAKEKIARHQLTKTLFTQDACAQSATDINAPVFIIGLPRSGTTLAEQVLSMHSGVWAGGERSEIPYWLDQTLAVARNNGHASALSFANGQRVVWRRAFLNPQDVNKRVVVDKTPGNLEHLPFIRWLLPEAKVIFMTRDPRDTTLSIFASPIRDSVSWAAGMNNILDYYRFSLTCLDETCGLDTISVSYESLVETLERATRRILSFCGLEWEENCLNFSQNQRAVHTLSATQVRQPLYNTSIGRWRNFEHGLAQWAPRFREFEQAQQAIADRLNQ